MRKKTRLIAFVLSILMILAILTGCQDELLDGSELDMSKLGPNEKYVRAARIYNNMETGEEYLERKYEYDKYGNLIRRIDYTKDGDVDAEKTWKYDKNGNLLERTVEGTRVYLHQEYTYNDNSQRIAYVKKRKSGGFIEEAEFKYWDNGNLKQEKIRDYRGRKRVIFYNKKGDPERGSVANKQGEKIELKYTINYYPNEKKKKQVKKKVYKGEVIELFVDKYNKEGKQVEYKRRGGLIETWLGWKYNDDGKIIKFISKDKNGKIEDWEEYKYDENGNRIEHKRYDIKDNGKKILWLWEAYRYDKAGRELAIKDKNDKGKVNLILESKFKIIKVKKGSK